MAEMTDPEQIYLTAARAWCLAKFPYDHQTPEERERHIAYDAAGTADEPWLRAVVDVVRAAERDRILAALALQHANQVRRAIGEAELRADAGPDCTESHLNVELLGGRWPCSTGGRQEPTIPYQEQIVITRHLDGCGE